MNYMKLSFVSNDFYCYGILASLWLYIRDASCVVNHSKY